VRPQQTFEPGMVVSLDRDCELGQEGERAVVMDVDGAYMTLVFVERSKDRKVRTGTNYSYLKVVP
jgi:hypothetical protein